MKKKIERQKQKGEMLQQWRVSVWANIHDAVRKLRKSEKHVD